MLPELSIAERASIVGSFKPERSIAIRLAAAEFAGTVVIRAFDPSDPSERRSYGELASRMEHFWQMKKADVPPPRTPEEIDLEVIKPAESQGHELLEIDHHLIEGENLGKFWQRVDEIKTLRRAQAEDIAKS